MGDLCLNFRQAESEGRLAVLAFTFLTELPYISYVALEKGELVVHTVSQYLLPFLEMLKNAPQYRFEQLMDICGVDYPQRSDRFDVVYNLLSVSYNRRIRVIVTTDEVTPVPSVHQLWPCATWWERECYDLFGILFSGQPDLRRILTDNGFEGHPLRKDFPLTGYEEVRYDMGHRRVVKEPVSLTQDFRDFDFVSPWESVLTLPGDEKAREVL